MPPKKSKFNFNASRVFLTYPRCDLDKEELVEFAKTIQEPVTFYVCREKHQDGTNHLHAVFCWGHPKIHTSRETFFDCKGYHPHIKKIPNAQALANFIQYVKKDGDFITNEVQVLGKRQLLFTEMFTTGLTPQFVRLHPEICQFNFNNLKQWLSLVRPDQVVLKDLPKQRHIWLHGPGNTGKTTFFRRYQLLFESVRQIPYNNDYAHIDYNCDLLFADEYRGQLTVQQLNRLCDGGAHLNTKGSSIVLGQPLVFIISNYSIADCYPGVDDVIRNTLLARFRQYLTPLFPKFPSYEL